MENLPAPKFRRGGGRSRLLLLYAGLLPLVVVAVVLATALGSHERMPATPGVGIETGDGPRGLRDPTEAQDDWWVDMLSLSSECRCM